MKWVKSDHEGLPIKSWCEDLEDKALEQALDLARHPVVVRHVALMPDAHMGYGMPIGGVIACDHAVIPYAVGSDIGCGMCAVKTTVNLENKGIKDKVLKRIMGDTRKAIPMGVGKNHKEDQPWEGFDEAPCLEGMEKLIPNARKQLGTLGAGNHFIELQAGDDDHLWLMLHSGSRNLGYKLADQYHKLAVEHCEKWHSNIPNKQLAFFPRHREGTEGEDYMSAMNFALKYAKANRQHMMDRLKEIVGDAMACDFEDEINIHHNYATWENHFGRNLIVHRKGATSAKEGQMGIIPGSMGTNSYIVRGKGNPESFNSCSHGAGRVMGRKEANRRLTVEKCNEAMKGVLFGRWSKLRKGDYDLSEAPQAYKDIDAVIEAQSDLVDVVVKLRPLAAMKGVEEWKT